ncbi:exosortase C-terminal domain/associated protein EpsI [Thiovibrio sp. JS02]
MEILTKKQSAGFPAISPLRLALVLGAFALVFLLLRGVSGIGATPALQPLSNFPAVLGPYRLQGTQQSSAAVVEMLGVTDYISYTYADGKGKPVRLYVAYYDFVNDTKGYHSPKNCLPGSGWGIAEVKPQTVSLAKGAGSAEVTEMVIRNRNEQQIVLYWYQNRGRIIPSEYKERLYRVLDSLLMRRSDGSFVRIMLDVPEGGDFAKSEAAIRDFAALTLAELQRFVPGR